MENKATSASQALLEILGYISFLGRLIGLDILDPNYRKNFLTALVFSWLCAYPIFAISTVLRQFDESWMIVLESTCLSIAVFQGGVKFTAAIVKQKTINELADSLVNIYQDYEKRSQHYADELIESNRRLRKAMKIMFTTCFLPCIAITCIPFIMLLIGNNNRVVMIPLSIPYINLNTTSGYFTTLGIQASILIIGTIGLFVSDVIVLVFFMQSYIFSDILRLKIQEFNVVLDDDGNENHWDRLQRLLDIVEWQQRYSNFTDTCNDCYYWIVVACVSSSGLGIVLTLFMILASDWPGAYPYLVLGFHTLYVYCIMGTKIEICNDRFIDEIYEINWYNMNSKQQKIVLFVLMRSQNPKNIKIAGIVPLSVETGLRITKTIYSIFMMMIQFLGE